MEHPHSRGELRLVLAQGQEACSSRVAKGPGKVGTGQAGTRRPEGAIAECRGRAKGRLGQLQQAGHSSSP